MIIVNILAAIGFLAVGGVLGWALDRAWREIGAAVRRVMEAWGEDGEVEETDKEDER